MNEKELKMLAKNILYGIVTLEEVEKERKLSTEDLKKLIAELEK